VKAITSVEAVIEEVPKGAEGEGMEEDGSDKNGRRENISDGARVG
jgi:hypothetical protein